jgi:beta-galactosidase
MKLHLHLAALVKYSEQFVESVERLNLDSLHYKLSNNSQDSSQIGENDNNLGWSEAFQKGYGEYETGRYILFRGSFNLDYFTDKTTITFFSKSIVGDQSVYLNGKLLSMDLTEKDQNQVYVLDNNTLHKGINTLVFVGKPFVKKTEWEELNTNPGIIKVQNPALPWKRKTFNGLAQIIIKTTKQAGDITLTATSEGMITAVLKLKSTGVSNVNN